MQEKQKKLEEKAILAETSNKLFEKFIVAQNQFNETSEAMFEHLEKIIEMQFDETVKNFLRSVIADIENQNGNEGKP